MKRKTSRLPSRVYVYGLLDPTDGHDKIEEQIRLGHRYYNQLIEIEHNRREAYRQICREQSADVRDIEGQIAVLTEWIVAGEARTKGKRQKARKRITSAASGPTGDLKKARKAKRAALRAERKKVTKQPEVKPRMQTLNERAKQIKKAARANCGVYWGTYLLIEDSAEQAGKAPVDPDFRRTRFYNDKIGDDGRVGVQIQKGPDRRVGMAVSDLRGGTDTRLRLTTESLPVLGRRGQRLRGKSRPRLQLRVGSQGRAPIWAEWPIILHRPLPPTARIKKVTVQRRRIGMRFRWEALFYLEDVSFMAPAEPVGTGAAAIDVGWRKFDEHFRVAYLVESPDGELLDRPVNQPHPHVLPAPQAPVEMIDSFAAAKRPERVKSPCEVRLPGEVVDAFEHADSLRAIRDRRWDELRPWLAKWLSEHRDDLPDWLRRPTTHLANWRATVKLVRLACRWCERRFPGDEEAFARVDEWRRQEMHLYQWESAERAKALGRRREFFRLAARRLARSYATISREDLNLAALARLPTTEEDDEAQAARVYRFQVATGQLREELMHQCHKSGCKIELRAPEYTTMRCAVCAELCRWDQAKEVRHQCEHCGAEWDQDGNASANLLAAPAAQ